MQELKKHPHLSIDFKNPTNQPVHKQTHTDKRVLRQSLLWALSKNVLVQSIMARQLSQTLRQDWNNTAAIIQAVNICLPEITNLPTPPKKCPCHDSTCATWNKWQEILHSLPILPLLFYGWKVLFFYNSFPGLIEKDYLAYKQDRNEYSEHYPITVITIADEWIRKLLAQTASWPWTYKVFWQSLFSILGSQPTILE